VTAAQSWVRKFVQFFLKRTVCGLEACPLFAQFTFASTATEQEQSKLFNYLIIGSSPEHDDPSLLLNTKWCSVNGGLVTHTGRRFQQIRHQMKA